MTSNNAIVPNFDDESDASLKFTLFKIDNVSNCILVVLNGYIDTYNSNYFQKSISKIIDAGFVKLIFNCAALNYVSSTGIGSLTNLLKIVKSKNGDIVLFGVQQKVFDAFRLLGFSQFFNIKNTDDEAISYFNSASTLGAQTFPIVFPCPVCKKSLKAICSGRFRCSECKSILAVDDHGKAFLG